MPWILEMSVNPNRTLRDESCAHCEGNNPLGAMCCGMCAFWVRAWSLAVLPFRHIDCGCPCGCDGPGLSAKDVECRHVTCYPTARTGAHVSLLPVHGRARRTSMSVHIVMILQENPRSQAAIEKQEVGGTVQ